MIFRKKDFNIVFEDSNYLSIPKEDMVLPKYTIGMDELSDSFSQAKMFLTVDQIPLVMHFLSYVK